MYSGTGDGGIRSSRDVVKHRDGRRTMGYYLPVPEGRELPLDDTQPRRGQVLLDALLDNDRAACWEITRACVDERMALTDIYQNVLRPPLYRIGELWEQNRISVAREHLATAIIEATMNRLFALIAPADPLGRRAVVACVEGESHQVGARMVADVLESRGWDAHFLGADTPTGELLRYLRDVRPELLLLSFSIYFHAGVLLRMVREIRQAFGDLRILVGGQALRYGDAFAAHLGPGAHVVGSLDELTRCLTKWEASGGAR